MDDSSFEAMADEVEGLLGIDPHHKAHLSFDTISVHGYGDVDAKTGSITSPVYQSATFAHPAFGASTGYCYSRCGNPTRLELENTIALMEGGTKAFAVSSGMTAIAALLKLFGPGDHLVVCGCGCELGCGCRCGRGHGCFAGRSGGHRDGRSGIAFFLGHGLEASPSIQIQWRQKQQRQRRQCGKRRQYTE